MAAPPHDVQRRVGPEVDPRRRVEQREQQHHDLPPPAQVRPQQDDHAEGDDRVPGRVGDAGRRHVPQDRSRDRAARSAALDQGLDQLAVHEQLQRRQRAQRQSEPPPAQHQRRDGDQQRHPEDAHQLEDPQHRLPGRRPAVDPAEDSGLDAAHPTRGHGRTAHHRRSGGERQDAGVGAAADGAATHRACAAGTRPAPRRQASHATTPHGIGRNQVSSRNTSTAPAAPAGSTPTAVSPAT